ncbi:pore-forming ESAT-6 family protein [Paracoccus bogoriensis]|uniref:pore-forming ESAT-6 family protein n=1 Tax=Paracoccus bogoriensis TaxID=242065 RepID=UPI001CA501ED|nr:pore-forming ESAT-6 family protein [Paracoccus bogoriensis]MBW7055208.1 pore-forming ESAT-6 family protein [Paracoccus bogoriensis]
MIRHIALVLGVSLTAPAAIAQEAAAPEGAAVDAAATYEAARNQLGILKYCQAQGFTGDEAVAVQTRLVGMIPAGDTAAGDAAEARGTEGVIAIGDTQITLAEAVAGQGGTVEGTCKEIETAVNEVGASLPAG